MKIAAVLSDLGMVHLHYNDDEAYRLIGSLWGVTREAVEQVMWRGDDPLGVRLSNGQTVMEDFPGELARRLNVTPLNSLGCRVFQMIYCDAFQVVPQVDRLYRQLKRRGLVLAAVTNIDPWRYDWVRRRGWLNLYDEVVVSYEEGLVKPSDELLVRTLDRLGLPAEAVLFVDDRPENLVPAVALGLPTHHFVSPRRLKRELAKLGVI